jgi:hypothetical protein
MSTSRSIVLLGLTAVLASAATSTVIVVAFSSPDEAPGPGGQPLGTELITIRQQLGRLSEQDAALEARINGLELAAMTGEPRGDEVLPMLASPEAIAELQDELSALAATVGDGGGEAFVANVAQALELIRTAEEQQRDEEREVRRQERLDERVTELTELLGLDVYQQEQMRALLAEADEVRDELRDQLRETRDLGAARDEIDALREQVEQGLTAFLSPHQLELLEESGGLGLDRFGGGAGRRGGRAR